MISNLVLCLDGRELNIPVQLTESQIRQIYQAAASDKKMNGWEKSEIGNCFFYADGLNRVQSVTVTENSITQRDLLYNAANCYSSEMVAVNMARADALLRKLRRYCAEHRSESTDWRNGGYTILFDGLAKTVEVGATGEWLALGDIVFETEEIAQDAIKEYYEELLWYFTEMKDTL